MWWIIALGYLAIGLVIYWLARDVVDAGPFYWRHIFMAVLWPVALFVAVWNFVTWANSGSH